MALNFPDSPTNGQTYTINGVVYIYNSNKGYWLTDTISGGGSTPNDATVTLSAGTGLIGGGAFTTDQSFNETIAFNIDLNELSTSTTDGDGDYFVVVDTSGVERKLTKGNINISGFNNNSGYITASSTATLTNKSGNISQWTNDSGYITGYTETDTLATVTARGATTLAAISVNSITATNPFETSVFLNGAFNGMLTANSTLAVKASLTDINGSAGASGQILSSTGSGVDWIDAPSGTGGTGGITTGKAIAMAMVFG